MSTGAPGSGTEVIALRVLRAAGLDPDRDVTRQGLGATESAGALKDGKVAAFFWSGGLPTAAVQDLAHSQGMTIRLLAERRVLSRRCSVEYGDLYFPLEIPAGAYRGVDQAVAVVGVANVLVVNRSMPDDLAYDITRVLFEKKSELAAIHPEAAHLSLERAADGIAGASIIPARSGTTPSRRPTDERLDQRSTHRTPAARVVTDPLEPFQESSGRSASRDRSDRSPPALAIGLSLYSLYWVLFIVQPQVYRVSFLLVALVLIFLLFPARSASRRDRVALARLGSSSARRSSRSSWPIVGLQPLRLPRRRSRCRSTSRSAG